MPVTLTFDADAYRPGTRHRPHAHGALHFSLVLSGRVAESVGRETEYAEALSVVAKAPGVVHANDFGAAGAKLARLTLPGGSIATLIDDPARAAEWRWTHDARVAAPFLRLVRRGRDGARAVDADDVDLVDLLAAFTARPAPSPRGRPPAWLADAMSDLRGGWHPGRTVADVARRAGVHPVYLARCVRRWYGTAVSDELRALRLRAAAAAITATRATMSHVAHAHGFADEPHLCRDFSRATGLTPRRCRTLVAALDYRWRGRRAPAGEVARIQV